MKKLLLFCLFIISGSAFSQVDVTFKVDMRGYGQPFVTANVNGTFNGWCGACNPMTDANNDSIWEATISLPAGTIEYKFTVDGWTAQEMLTPGSTCTATNSGFTNRVYTIVNSATIPVTCWATCGACVPLGPQKLQIRLPITWQDSATVNLTTSDFGGTYSVLAPDPANASLLALKVVKTAAAETWAGTTLSTAAGLFAPIPFSSTSNQMQMAVYSPTAGTPFRLKAEDKADPTHSVETEAMSTTSNAWEVLTFNFLNQSQGTSAINYGFTYNKISLFPNFGTGGAAAGEQTYYLGGVAFGTLAGVSTLVGNTDLLVFPNPTTGSFEINSSLLANRNSGIVILDVMGRKVYSEVGNFANGSMKLNISHLENGIYTIQVTGVEKTLSQRVVVSK